MDDKSEYRGVNILEDSSFGVEMMLCVIGLFVYGDIIDKSNYSIELGWSLSNENLYFVIDG